MSVTVLHKVVVLGSNNARTVTNDFSSVHPLNVSHISTLLTVGLISGPADCTCQPGWNGSAVKAPGVCSPLSVQDGSLRETLCQRHFILVRTEALSQALLLALLCWVFLYYR